MRQLFLFICALALSACSQEHQQVILEAKLQEIRSAPKGRIEPLPTYPQPTKAHYRQPARDPFQPYFAPQQAAQQITPNPNRILEPLEHYELSQLSFRGVMQKGEHLTYLVLTPDNQLVRVNLGNRLGTNHGQVIRLTKNSLVLRELVAAETHWVEQETIIQLK